jgi:DNA-binding transcriptional LysR family regulator
MVDLTAAHLRSFLAVAEELHFGRAAERLHVSPSSISEHVATLEHRIGKTLFHRTSRSVTLTEDGVRLMPLAQRAVDAMDEVVSWAKSAAERTSIRIGLAVFSTQFRAIYAAAQRDMPEIDWHIAQLGFADPFRAVFDGDVDCALIPATEPLPRRILATPLWSDSCVLIVAETHRLAQRTAVEVSELLDETFITVGDASTSAHWLGSVLRDAPRTLPIARNFDEVLELCAAGVDVNVAGASGAEIYQRPGVRFVPICDLDDRTTYLCVAKGRSSAAIRRFARLAARVARTGGPSGSSE